jgi:pyridoxal 5'-phosphate synthase pdxT subunit
VRCYDKEASLGESQKVKIGVLAMQGGFIEHIKMLESLCVDSIPVYNPGDLEGIDGLIIPGGESTSILNLLHTSGLFDKIREKALSGLPVMGTCAGMVLMAKNLAGDGMKTLGLMDITVRRNAFGRQVESRETNLSMPSLGERPFPGIFIRAPIIERVAPDVEVLCRLDDGTIIAARQGNFLAFSFHPELGCDTRLHRYFIEMVQEHLKK